MTLNCDVLFLWWGLVVWGRNPTTWCIEKGDTLKWTSRTKTRSFFCVLFFLEPGKARRTCAGSFVKEAREHMFTVRLLDREG